MTDCAAAGMRDLQALGKHHQPQLTRLGRCESAPGFRSSRWWCGCGPPARAAQAWPAPNKGVLPVRGKYYSEHTGVQAKSSSTCCRQHPGLQSNSSTVRSRRDSHQPADGMVTSSSIAQPATATAEAATYLVVFVGRRLVPPAAAAAGACRRRRCVPLAQVGPAAHARRPRPTWPPIARCAVVAVAGLCGALDALLQRAALRAVAAAAAEVLVSSGGGQRPCAPASDRMLWRPHSSHHIATAGLQGVQGSRGARWTPNMNSIAGPWLTRSVEKSRWAFCTKRSAFSRSPAARARSATSRHCAAASLLASFMI